METVCCLRRDRSLKPPENSWKHLGTHRVPQLLQVMARSESDVIDFSALERELQAAAESDRRHRRENAAKLRAVSQRGSYSQFRDLVLTCHLRPLEQKDKQGAPRKQPWNPVAARSVGND